MLKTRFEFDTDMLHFFCPFCGSDDLLYTSMPYTCWSCGKSYFFDVTEIVTNQHSRYQYYKNEKTYEGG